MKLVNRCLGVSARATFLAMMVLVGSPLAEADEPRTWRVAGYLPDYRVADYDLSRAVGVTDLIVFSATPKADGTVDLSRLDGVTPWTRLQTWKTEHRVRLILSLGGWERSQGFAAVARDPQSRQHLARHLLQLCLDRRLDGVDFDWEHPQGDDEVRHYGELLAEVRSAFKPHGLQLSVTMAAWQQLSQEGVDAVDAVQVMSYDHPGDHATFEQSLADLKNLRDAGVPSGKLVLGLPFYGRHHERREETATYADLAQRALPASLNEHDGMFFNGPDLIAAKVRHAREAGLAGVMIWELGQDAPGERSLLGTVIKESSKTVER